MINYMKSEWYRTTHGKGFYVTASIMAGLVLLMNMILAVSQRYIPDFRYGTFRFSLNTLTAVPFVMVILGAVIPGCLFIDDRKNGVMKNVIAYGISRTEIFVGKCIVAFFSASIILVVVTAVYVGSAYLLLQNYEWLPLREMLSAIGSGLPSAAVSLIVICLLGSLFQNEMAAVLWWAIIFYVIPIITFLAGLKFEIIGQIAKWMPYNMFNMEVQVSMNTYQCLWDTPEGLTRCLVSGILGILIFMIFGIWKFKKQEF